jgi:hypothetical protein
MFTKLTRYYLPIAAIAWVALSTTAGLAAPTVMNFQGRLADSLGVPLSGNYSIDFRQP